MTLKEITKITNGSYVDNPRQLAQKIGISNSDEMLEFLKLVYSYNNDFIKQQNERIIKLKETEARSKETLVIEKKEDAKSDSNNNNLIQSQSTPDKKTQELLRLIEACPIKNISSILPSRDDPSFHSVMNELMIACSKDIVFSNSYLLELGDDISSSEKEEIEKQIQHKRLVFNYLKEYRHEDNKDSEEVIKTSEPPFLVHLTTSTNNSYLYQDLEELPQELRKHFLRIYEPLITGKPIVLNRMTFPREIVYVKNKVHQARIYMTHISSNIYAVLGARNKKAFWNKNQQNFIINRYGIWTNERDTITQKINDPSYLEEQKEMNDRVLQLLKRGQ